MEFLTKIKDKIDSTKEYLTNKFSDTNKEYFQEYENKANSKEIIFNQIESKKVKYLKKASTYELTLLINGDSIFQNLILTANASKNGEQIPIKCQWKRVYEESVITIQDINSYSYIPSAEDIGYIIEVEVASLDDPDDISIAQWCAHHFTRGNQSHIIASYMNSLGFSTSLPQNGQIIGTSLSKLPPH